MEKKLQMAIAKCPIYYYFGIFQVHWKTKFIFKLFSMQLDT